MQHSEVGSKGMRAHLGLIILKFRVYELIHRDAIVAYAVALRSVTDVVHCML